jgi:hypothetical protein
MLCPFMRGELGPAMRSTAFSALSRNFDLNSEATTARTEQSSLIISPA